MNKPFIFFLLPVFAGMAGQAKAQIELSDTLSGVSLDSIVVHSTYFGRQLRTDPRGALRFDMQMMNDLPKMLGNADPLRYAQMLPGIATSREYDAGLHVMGSENSHNYVSLDGTPIYGAAHILGLFSVFNAAHFQQMKLHKNGSGAMTPDRLGAELSMEPYSLPTDTLSGELAVGIISSQGTMRIPVTQGAELAVSLRASYLNLLYGSLLRGNDASLQYSFCDANVTYHHRLNARNRILLNFYYGNDDTQMAQKKIGGDMKLKWNNLAASAAWTYDSGVLRVSNNAYFSSNVSRPAMVLTEMNVDLNSRIMEVGDKLRFDFNDWTIGADMAHLRLRPQIPQVESSFLESMLEQPLHCSTQLSAYAERAWTLTPILHASTGVRLTHYRAPEESYLHLSPSASLTIAPSRRWDASLSYSFRHQYLHQTGMSSLGLPVEFWLTSGAYGLKPQASHSLILTTRWNDRHGRYSVTFEAYSKWLQHQTEYSGTIYSFLFADYNLQRLLHTGEGHNYGCSVMLSKNTGLITGWVSYAYGRAMRTFHDETLQGTFPSLHERLHEVNAVAKLHPGKRWDIGATLVYATGSPFTPLRYGYMLNKTIVSEFGDYNSARLRPYFRIDASVNYHLKPRKYLHEHGLNLSLYNLSARSNDQFYFLEFNDKEFRYKRVTLPLRVIPSLSYYLKF